MNTFTLTELLKSCAELDPLIIVLTKLTGLLAIAWCGHWLMLRANPRWRVSIWRFAAIGLLLVPLLHAAAPAVPVSSHEVVSGVGPVAIASESEIGPAGDPISAVMSLPVGEEVVSHGSQLAHSIAESSVSSRTILIGVWIVGCLFCLLRVASGAWYVRRLIDQSDEATDAVLESFRTTREAVLAGERVAVRVSSRITTPILCGILQPTVLIPVGLADESRGDHLPAVFAHELAHVKSRDLFWNTLIHVLSSALWFHPLAWFARSAHAAGCEAVSDAIAVGHVGDVKAYGSTLAQVALDATVRPPTLSLAMSRSTRIGRRVQALERKVHARSLSVPIASAAIVCCLVIVAVVGGIKVVSADELAAQDAVAKPGLKDKANAKLMAADAAVEKALKYLAARQHVNGAFGGSQTPQHNPATTGLVGMAMLASGSKPGEGPYGTELQKAIDYTISCVGEDGVIGNNSGGLLYVHAYALRFLAEAQLASKSENVTPTINKAVDVIVKSQNSLGGWRYTKKSRDADSSATSCILIALATARKAGVEIPQETFDRATKYLKSCQAPDGGFGYTSPPKQSAGPRSAAVISALCLSRVRDDQVSTGIGYLSNNLNPTDTSEAFYFYGQLHLATAMRYASEKQFRSWHEPITEQLLKSQLPDGSWSLKSTESEYPTAQACLVLLSRHGKK